VPVALYYLLRATGLSALTALALSAVPPAIGAAWQLAVRRHADPVALLVQGTVVLALILSVAVHSPRFLLAKDGLITGLWGLWFLATAVPERTRRGGTAGRGTAAQAARAAVVRAARRRSCSPGRCWRAAGSSPPCPGMTCGGPSRGSAGSGGCPA